jgi:hypothetical protein
MKTKLGMMYKIYLGRLRQHTDAENKISKYDAAFLLTNIFRVPKDIRYSVLKEMEQDKLIVSFNRRDYLVK